jgi:hypothetical protein
MDEQEISSPTIRSYWEILRSPKAWLAEVYLVLLALASAQAGPLFGEGGPLNWINRLSETVGLVLLNPVFLAVFGIWAFYMFYLAAADVEARHRRALADETAIRQKALEEVRADLAPVHDMAKVIIYSANRDALCRRLEGFRNQIEAFNRNMAPQQRTTLGDFVGSLHNQYGYINGVIRSVNEAYLRDDPIPVPDAEIPQFPGAHSKNFDPAEHVGAINDLRLQVRRWEEALATLSNRAHAQAQLCKEAMERIDRHAQPRDECRIRSLARRDGEGRSP